MELKKRNKKYIEVQKMHQNNELEQNGKRRKY